MPLIGANGGLLGSQRTTNTTTAPGLWTPNEQVLLRRVNTWPRTDDLYWANVSLLLHMDGTNNSTTFTDSSVNGLTVTANGDAKISTAQSRFGGASAVFDGTGDYLTIAPSNFYDFSSSDATIECWLYVSTLSNPFQIIGTNNGPGDGKWLGAFVTTSGSVIGAGSAGAGAAWTAAAGTITTGSWIHIAIVYSGTSALFFKNGTQVATGTKSASYAFNNATLYISRLDGNNSYCLNGYIDELRITKGIARYTSNFTPPTTAFPNA